MSNDLLFIRNTSSLTSSSTSWSTSSSRQRIALRSAWTARVAVTAAASLLLFLQPTLGVASTSDGVLQSSETSDEHPRAPLGRFTSSLDLQCPTCDRIHCTPRRANKLKCKGGISRGICNCCPVCAKTEGESCGGQWHYLGKCDAELVCEAERALHANAVDTDDAAAGHGPMTPVAGTTSWAHWKPEGKCRKRLTTQSDQPQNVDRPCFPRCTSEYCRAHPRAVCSAIDNAERKQPCQAECQHTSCGACSFVRPDTECVKCRRDDLACIRKFGRCIRRLHCNRTKQLCRHDKDEGARLKFQCLVPSCFVAP